MNKIKNTYTKDLYKPLDSFKNNYNIVYHTIDTNNSSLRELVIVDKNKKGFYRIDSGYFGKSEEEISKEIMRSAFQADSLLGEIKMLLGDSSLVNK